MSEFSIIAVFLVGLLGGVHCLGMCGSIVGIFTTQLSADRARWPFHLAYSSGRVTSYAVAGALVGAIGQAGFLMRDAVPVQHLLFALSSLMLVLLGLYIAGLWGAVRKIESLGGGLWKHLQPFTKKLLPANTVPRALALGALWGWLPCGLVYSVLVTSLASGSAVQGALIMAAFGLGTLPNLLAIGMFWERIKHHVQSPRVRMTAGLVVVGFGLYGLFRVGFIFYTHGWTEACHVPA
jgi:sulfite exporter TauE/SafE